MRRPGQRTAAAAAAAPRPWWWWWRRLPCSPRSGKDRHGSGRLAGAHSSCPALFPPLQTDPAGGSSRVPREPLAGGPGGGPAAPREARKQRWRAMYGPVHVWGVGPSGNPVGYSINLGPSYYRSCEAPRWHWRHLAEATGRRRRQAPTSQALRGDKLSAPAPRRACEMGRSPQLHPADPAGRLRAPRRHCVVAVTSRAPPRRNCAAASQQNSCPAGSAWRSDSVRRPVRRMPNHLRLILTSSRSAGRRCRSGDRRGVP